MRIYRMNTLMRFLLRNVSAITLFPFGMFVREWRLLPIVIEHEDIHWRQQKEMLCIPFYVWYLFEWLIKIPFAGRYAYLSISFEQEAYKGGDRKRFGWVKYIFKIYKK
jgi:hypothetical protein